MILAVGALSGIELAKMSKAGDYNEIALYVIPFISIGGLSIALALEWLENSTVPGIYAVIVGGISSITVLAIVSAATVAKFRRRPLEPAFAALLYAVLLAMGVGVVVLSNGRELLVLALAVTFFNDTGAYLVGRTVGRRLFVPSISPKKTWEGVFGGAFAAVASSVGANYLLNLDFSLWQALLLGILLSFGGMFGDLGESMLKRRVGVKDSGWIIPGHGGILDRIDSVAPNLAVVYLFALWIMV